MDSGLATFALSFSANLSFMTLSPSSPQRTPAQNTNSLLWISERLSSSAFSATGMPPWMWLVKILWTSSRLTRSYFTGSCPGTLMPTMGSLLQRPVQPVLRMTTSVRPEDLTCLTNSSMTSREPAACSQVAEPTWITIFSWSLRAAVASATRDRSPSKN